MSASMVKSFRMPMDFYPLKEKVKTNRFERGIENVLSRFEYSSLKLKRVRETCLTKVWRLADDLTHLSDFELQAQIGELRFSASQSGITDAFLCQAFALTRELSGRKLGKRHYRAQIRGAWAMMKGMIAEMETGQGKSLTATLAAAAAGLAGVPTHVITVNEYLAVRDAQEFKPLYHALGLSVGIVTEDMDEDQKRKQYANDITYVTNKQVAFDHLRDRMLMRQKNSKLSLQLENLYSKNTKQKKLLLKGLCFGIVDEADSVLIDEAVTPLVISASHKNEQKLRFYEKALYIARSLVQSEDFKIDEKQRNINLSYQGRKKLEREGERLGGVWEGALLRTELVESALKAIHLFFKDKHYLINEENEVKLIDEFTGRIMADRSWEGGLQQMVEIKEGCEMSADRETIARISYQRFFTRYRNLCGMTGTAREVEKELWDVYRLKVMTIAPEQNLQRRQLVDSVCINESEKWKLLVLRIKEIHQRGLPILVGTRSVETSELISALLTEEQLDHSLLNARQDQHEAGIVAQAGQFNRITVATNMAGRGTDIKLDEQVKSLGGLYVIATERHESRRIDRQLFGRCGRQGDPGVAEAIVSLDDEVLTLYGSKVLKFFFKSSRVVFRASQNKSRLLSLLLFKGAQNKIEAKQRSARVQLLALDEHFESVLSFGGRSE